MTNRCEAVDADDPLELLGTLRSALDGARSPVLPVRREDVSRVLAGLDLSAPTPSEVAVVVATSGSTGAPKAAMLAARALLASARATHERLGGPGQWLLALPASSIAGVQVLTRSVLAGTEPAVAVGSGVDDLRAALERMTGERRYAALVPTQLRRALRDPGTAAALTRLDALLLGAAAADEELLATAADAGVTVVTTYGMTETCGGCVYDGVPLDGVGVQVRPLGPTAGDGPGRIELAGPTLFAGYLGRPDLTADVLHDGWLHTNDLGELEVDGRLSVYGRLDDVVVSGGVNVALSRVRGRLVEHPDVGDAACLGVPDAEWGTAVVAFVVPAHGAVVHRDTVRTWVADALGRASVPRRVEPIPELPMLPNGKVDLSTLRGFAAALGNR